MSASNGHATERAARASMMFVATEDFEAEYDGQRVELKAGIDRCGGDHPLVIANPSRFAPVPSDQQGGQRSIEHRMLGSGGSRQPAPTRSLEEELRVRRERLAQLDACERDRPRPTPRSAEDQFWANVDRLLADPQREREDAEAMALLDELDRGRTHLETDGGDSLAGWLDE